VNYGSTGGLQWLPVAPSIRSDGLPVSFAYSCISGEQYSASSVRRGKAVK
jgi:hypothetical protein